MLRRSLPRLFFGGFFLAGLFFGLAVAGGCTPRPTTLAQGGGDEGGIGGTGISDGGIGGTGIVGTITGFGSIVVNGLHVDYPATMPVGSIYGAAPAGALKVGQVVAVEAENRGGLLWARSIALRYPVTGPVEWIDHGRGEIGVLGQRVSIADDTLAGTGGQGPRPVLDNLTVGDMVDISGLRDGDLIRASRVERRNRGGVASLFGPVTATGDGGIAIAGRRLNFAGGVPSGLHRGDVVQLTGDPDARAFRVRSLRQLPTVPFGGRMRSLSVEGFVTPAAAGRGQAVGGVPFDAGGIGAGLRRGERVVLTGEVSPRGRFVAREARQIRFTPQQSKVTPAIKGRNPAASSGVWPSPRRDKPDTITPGAAATLRKKKAKRSSGRD